MEALSSHSVEKPTSIWSGVFLPDMYIPFLSAMVRKDSDVQNNQGGVCSCPIWCFIGNGEAVVGYVRLLNFNQY